MSEGERTAAFAHALLDGKVFPALQDLRKAFVANPGLVARPEAQAHRRVSDLLAALKKAGVDSKAALARALAARPTFLRAEVAQWLQKGTDPALLDRCWRRMLGDVESGAGGVKLAERMAGGPRPPAAAALDHVDLSKAPLSLSNARGLKRPAEKPAPQVVTFKQKRRG